MTSRAWVWAFGIMLVAGSVTAAAEDNARRKDRSSDRGSSVGARHHAGDSGRSSGRGDSGGSIASAQSSRRDGGSRGRGADPGPGVRRVSGAEARHPEAGTGHGWRVGRYGYYYSRPYYSSSYRYPYYWYRPYYWGAYGVPYYDFYWSSWDYPYYRGGYYYSDRYGYRDTASIRTLVDPERTNVFVDGYYAGTVDDFDGLFQRLHVSPGRHDIAFKLEGYRTYVVRVYATSDHTIKIRHDMDKGSGPDAVEDLTGGREEPPYRIARDDDRVPPRDGARPELEREDDRQARDVGTLRVDVRPDDASIYVDGQFFGTARRASSLTLPAGRHRVEVVRPGYRTVERDVEIRPGRSETVTIDLERS